MKFALCELRSVFEQVSSSEEMFGMGRRYSIDILLQEV